MVYLHIRSSILNGVNLMKIISRYLIVGLVGLLLLGSAGSAWSGSQAAAGLLFENAWIRAMPPGMKMTAGFGTLVNTGGADTVLVAFSSPDFGDVSLHRTEQADGVSRMREVKELVIPAKGRVELAPGGYHLMLMMPVGDMDKAQPVTLRMSASDGSSFEFLVSVERR